MSAVVKLGSKMPADFETNGLDFTRDELVDDPQTLRAGFVQYDVGKIMIDPDTGEKVPTVRIRRFEPLGQSDKISAEIQQAYFKAVEDRTGKKALPLEFAEVVDQGQLEGGPDNVTVGDF